MRSLRLVLKVTLEFSFKRVTNRRLGRVSVTCVYEASVLYLIPVISDELTSQEPLSYSCDLSTIIGSFYEFGNE